MVRQGRCPCTRAASVAADTQRRLSAPGTPQVSGAAARGPPVLLLLLPLLLSAAVEALMAPLPRRGIVQALHRHRSPAVRPMSSPIFYNDFEDFESGDDQDKQKEDKRINERNNKDNDDLSDDEEYEDDDLFDSIDDMAVSDFRSRLSSGFGEAKVDAKDATGASSISSVDDLLNFVNQKARKEREQRTDWARPAPGIKEGVVLLAHPVKFCTDFGGTRNGDVSAALLGKFGLTLPPPTELGPDRRADLLPVLLVVEVRGNACKAVLLNRRTGYLLGDLEQPAATAGGGEGAVATPLLEKFCVQPLWFGGVENDSMGLDMLHQCPTVTGAKPLTEDGLFWGGDPAQAQDAMSNPGVERVLTGFDFKFFVQSTIWKVSDLQREIDDGTWFLANVSKEVLFKSRDRMGTQRAKPLWTECMELLGGKCKQIRDELYRESTDG